MTTLQESQAAQSPCTALKGREKSHALQAVLRWHLSPFSTELDSAQSLPPVSQLLAAANRLRNHRCWLDRVVQSNPRELLPGGRKQYLLGSPRPGLLQNNRQTHSFTRCWFLGVERDFFQAINALCRLLACRDNGTSLRMERSQYSKRTRHPEKQASPGPLLTLCIAGVTWGEEC